MARLVGVVSRRMGVVGRGSVCVQCHIRLMALLLVVCRREIVLCLDLGLILCLNHSDGRVAECICRDTVCDILLRQLMLVVVVGKVSRVVFSRRARRCARAHGE